MINDADAGQPGNPAPLPDDLILPMPGGRVMAFRPVCVSSGDGYFAWRRFRIGDPKGGYKESPTAVALGGAFQLQRQGERDWCYYLGKYEVSEDQFQVVTGRKKEWQKSRYPVRDLSWFEVQDFLRQYNKWLFQNALDKVPRYGKMPGYLRLPTESEWEFAARGGAAVDAAHFDRTIPYPRAKLADYEWFAGHRSSYNKVKKVGILKPNPLGLHDMLGNVAEMTRTLYQVEYYQGRSGWFVARGGHYLTDERRMRSSMRSEQEFYAVDRSGAVYPAHKKTLGFRVVISSLVFPNSQVSRAMKSAWNEYRQGRGQTMPAALSTRSTSARTGVSGTDAGQYLKRLQQQLAARGMISEDIRQTLDNLSSSLGEIQFTVQQAARDSAYAWIKIAGEQAFFVTHEARKLPIIRGAIESARKSGRNPAILAKYQAREQEIRQNIVQAMSSYTESIRQLGTTGVEAYGEAVTRYRSFLEKKKAMGRLQVALLPLVDQHARSYFQQKRTNDQQWLDELMRWAADH